MFGHFYNSSLRRYIVLMGDLFSNINVARKRSDGLKYIKVPITYTTKERFMQALDKINNIRNENGPAKIETIFPRMTLQLVDMQYNEMFKTGELQKSFGVKSHKPGKDIVRQYSPVPYKMIFELGIHTRYEDDMLQIVEQILPYFQPNFVCRIKELHENEIILERDVQITYQSISIDEAPEGDKITRRRLEWSLMFEVDGWLYPPLKDMPGIIRTVYTDFHAVDKSLDEEGSQFESVDAQVDPADVEYPDWDGSVKETISENIPIPTGDQPSKPRENK